MGDEDVLWRGFEARLERLEDVVKELHDVIDGNRAKRIIGLVASYDKLDELTTRLNSVVFMDSTGKHGLAHDVDVLMGRQTGADRRSEFRWKYWIPTIMAILAMSLTLLANLDKIKANLPKYRPGPLEAQIDQAKHPRAKKKIYRVRHDQENPVSDDIKESPPTPPK